MFARGWSFSKSKAASAHISRPRTSKISDEASDTHVGHASDEPHPRPWA
jgi:hypothetical protein